MSLFNQNYFELFDIPESYIVNLELLAEKYRALQSKWHPDRFASDAEHEKLQAVQMSSFLNQAFDTLQTPLSRAGYLLTLRDCDIEQVSQQDLGADLLMEQIQLREALEELPAGDSALDELERLQESVSQKLEICQLNFSNLIQEGATVEAKKTYHEMQFLVKLLKEIEISEEQRLGY